MRRAGNPPSARTIQESIGQSDGPAISLRIGIHTGNVVQTDDDFFGSVVNKAARIVTLAAPGEIRVSDATQTKIGERDDFHFSEMTSVQLEGFEGKHVIYRLE